MSRDYSSRHWRHLWNVRKDFPIWHLLKCAVYGWNPVPDRVFVSSPLFPKQPRDDR